MILCPAWSRERDASARPKLHVEAWSRPALAASLLHCFALFRQLVVGCMVGWLQLVGLQIDKCNQTGGSRTSRLHCFAAIAWKLDQGPLSVVLVLAREADAVEALT